MIGLEDDSLLALINDNNDVVGSVSVLGAFLVLLVDFSLAVASALVGLLFTLPVFLEAVVDVFFVVAMMLLKCENILRWPRCNQEPAACLSFANITTPVRMQEKIAYFIRQCE